MRGFLTPPISENAMTGMAIGLAISGYKPVLTHQRLDFSLLSIDQIVNAAANGILCLADNNQYPS